MLNLFIIKTFIIIILEWGNWGMKMFNKQVKKGARISTWQSEFKDHTPYHRVELPLPFPGLGGRKRKQFHENCKVRRYQIKLKAYINWKTYQKTPNNTIWAKASCSNSEEGDRRLPIRSSSLTEAGIWAWSGKGILNGSTLEYRALDSRWLLI